MTQHANSFISLPFGSLRLEHVLLQPAAWHQFAPQTR